MKLKTYRTIPTATLPTKAYPGDAGFDLYSAEKIKIPPSSSKTIRTGIIMEIPPHHVGLIWDKSGLASKNQITTMAGVIDSSYRGEIHVVLINHSLNNFYVEPEQKIAQIIIQKFESPIIVEVNSPYKLSQTIRGHKGFGSSKQKL